MEHDVIVAHQFGSTARAYLESVTHATGEDLELLAQEIALVPNAAALDLGCGAATQALRWRDKRPRSLPLT